MVELKSQKGCNINMYRYCMNQFSSRKKTWYHLIYSG